MVQEAWVSGLFLFEKKGEPGREVASAVFVKDLGMEGDRHARGGDRQVTLLQAEVMRWMEAAPMKGLCFKRYKANLEIEGLTEELLQPGTRLQLGTATLQVSESAKACFPKCPLLEEKRPCKLAGGAVCLRVVGSGLVNKNDKIVIIA